MQVSAIAIGAVASIDSRVFFVLSPIDCRFRLLVSFRPPVLLAIDSD